MYTYYANIYEHTYPSGRVRQLLGNWWTKRSNAVRYRDIACKENTDYRGNSRRCIGLLVIRTKEAVR